MNIIEEIHQYLTDTQRNNSDLHGGEAEYLRITSPIRGADYVIHPWMIELIWDHHDGEIQLACFLSGTSLEEAGQAMLTYLKAEDEPDKRECPECGLTRDHTHEL